MNISTVEIKNKSTKSQEVTVFDEISSLIEAN